VTISDLAYIGAALAAMALAAVAIAFVLRAHRRLELSTAKELKRLQGVVAKLERTAEQHANAIAWRHLETWQFDILVNELRDLRTFKKGIYIQWCPNDAEARHHAYEFMIAFDEAGIEYETKEWTNGGSGEEICEPISDDRKVTTRAFRAARVEYEETYGTYVRVIVKHRPMPNLGP